MCIISQLKCVRLSHLATQQHRRKKYEWIKLVFLEDTSSPSYIGHLRWFKNCKFSHECNLFIPNTQALFVCHGVIICGS